MAQRGTISLDQIIGVPAGGFPQTLSAVASKFVVSYDASTGLFVAQQPTEADLSLSDITTNNVSTSKHGLAPKLPNDATKYLDGTGAFTVPSGGGGGSFPFSGFTYPPLIGSLTWVNQAGMTPNASYSTTDPNVAVMKIPNNASLNNAWLVESAPATPYTKVMRFWMFTGSSVLASSAFGLIFRESSSGKVVSLELLMNGNNVQWRVQQWASPTTAGSTLAGPNTIAGLLSPYFQLKIEDDGTNRNYYVSTNAGTTYYKIYSETRTTYITADQIGFGGVCVTSSTGDYIEGSILDFT